MANHYSSTNGGFYPSSSSSSSTTASSRVIERQADHAGSWYEDDPIELSNQLDNWLASAGPLEHGPARAIISPHAGYQYCGSCAAYAYKEISPTITKRIFILGPSHHYHLDRCALSTATVYKTPLYDLVLDHDVYRELRSAVPDTFETMSLDDDEREHSIEMQLPFIARRMASVGSNGFKIVPILVGSLNNKKEELYGQLFAKYLKDPTNVFVISSDFCHWGARFRYQHYEKNWGEIYESIEKLDHLGMNMIESLDPSAFSAYLKEYRNTICGRHPIGVLLNAIHHLRLSAHNGERKQYSLRFLNYAQSSKCLRMRDSSVSYASASLKID